MLPLYAELTTVNRGAPCKEYPGTYFLYRNGQEFSHASGQVGESEALSLLFNVVYNAELHARSADYRGTYTLAWSASADDPRIGQVWFTGYYTVAERRVR